MHYWFDRAKASKEGSDVDAASFDDARSSFAKDDPYYLEMLKKFSTSESNFINRNVQKSP
jgi:hypothetical protein